MLELAATCNMNDKFKVKKINKIIKKHTPIIPALCSTLQHTYYAQNYPGIMCQSLEVYWL